MRPAKLGVRRWTNFRRLILQRDGYRCRYQFPGCTETATEVDHFVDRIAGGPVYDEDNCYSVCRPCHKEKDRKQRRGETISKPGFFRTESPRRRDLSEIHTPKNEAGPFISGPYSREPADSGA